MRKNRHNKAYRRLHREPILAARWRSKVRRPLPGNERLSWVVAPNAAWSMAFLNDALANGRRVKCLTVTDDFTRECVDIAVDYGIGGALVVRQLDQVPCLRG